jgi:hypothetical protein
MCLANLDVSHPEYNVPNATSKLCVPENPVTVSGLEGVEFN